MMDITKMVDEWLNGCSCSINNPLGCEECTLALIKSIYTEAYKNEAIRECEKIVNKDGLAGMVMASSFALHSAGELSKKLRAFKSIQLVK